MTRIRPAAQPHPPRLVLVAHGSSDPAAAVMCQTIVDRLRHGTRNAKVDVHLTFLDHGNPRLDTLLAQLAPGPVVLVPLLLATGYHVRVDIEAAAHRARRTGRPVAVAAALAPGPHPLLLAAADGLLAAANVPAQAALVLATAGTTDSDANAATAAVARAIAHHRGVPVVVAAASAAAPPTVGDVIADLGAAAVGQPGIAVLTWLLSPGQFARSVATHARAATVPVTGVLGDRPEITELLLLRYAEAVSASLPVRALGPRLRWTP